jgi:hypothetical protein
VMPPAWSRIDELGADAYRHRVPDLDPNQRA